MRGAGLLTRGVSELQPGVSAGDNRLPRETLYRGEPLIIHEAFEAVSYDSSNDKDIDGFFVDHEVEWIVVAQLKFNAKGKCKGRKGELLSVIHATDWLKDPGVNSPAGKGGN
jgi:hypothetical protein